MIRKLCTWIARNVFKIPEPAVEEPIETYDTPCIYCGKTVNAAHWIPPERVCCWRNKLWEVDDECSRIRKKAKEDRHQIELYKTAIREMEAEKQPTPPAER